jgi:hypothetical protein
MTEPEKPKRKFWRFHLATAIVLVFVASGLLRANMTDRMPKSDEASLAGENHDLLALQFLKLYMAGIRKRYGWPLVAIELVVAYEHEVEFAVDGVPPSIAKDTPFLRWNRTAVAIDSLVTVGLVLAVAFASEWLIRRREARKT